MRKIKLKVYLNDGSFLTFEVPSKNNNHEIFEYILDFFIEQNIKFQEVLMIENVSNIIN
ncbi:hypothetical protein SAMN05880501_11947 [Ureibacillus xyleni]|uniref:Uncharacterized protein n=1 Tax=Ureibacillus xyleni TaxID=614648 RepID=A0A285TQN3_9BACL|nr:hypothetical protein [Ureibacillus xyleni]SOC25727.1 hypothetical protein SAMN05880501_11947 [Ureibacillus xyleni]